MHFLNSSRRKRFLQDSAKRTGDVWSHYKPLLPDTLARHSCGTLCKTLSLNTLKHSCKTLLLDTLAWHTWNTSQYYFALQRVHTEPHSISNYTANLAQTKFPSSLYYKSCTRHFPALLCTTKFVQGTSQYHFPLQTSQSTHFQLHTSHSTFHTPHFTLNTPHFALHTPHSARQTPIHTLHPPLHTSHSTRGGNSSCPISADDPWRPWRPRSKVCRRPWRPWRPQTTSTGDLCPFWRPCLWPLFACWTHWFVGWMGGKFQQFTPHILLSVLLCEVEGVLSKLTQDAIFCHALNILFCIVSWGTCWNMLNILFCSRRGGKC